MPPGLSELIKLVEEWDNSRLKKIEPDPSTKEHKKLMKEFRKIDEKRQKLIEEAKELFSGDNDHSAMQTELTSF